MANIKSAKKRILVQAKREAQNKAFRTNLKTVIKRANAAIAANAEDKDVLVKAAVKKIDQQKILLNIFIAFRTNLL